MANSLEVRSPFVDNKLIEYILAHDSSYYDYKNPKDFKRLLTSRF